MRSAIRPDYRISAKNRAIPRYITAF